MSKFLVDTNVLDASASSIKSISSQAEELASTVGSFDVTDQSEEGFPFGNAKSVIMGNLEALATKLQNASTILESVSSSHTQLQNQLTQQRIQALNPVNTGSTGYSGGGGGYSGGGGASLGAGTAAGAGMSGMEGNEGSSSTTPTDLSPEADSSMIPSEKDLEEEEKEKDVETEEEKTEETDGENEEQKREKELETPEKVAYATMDSNKLEEATEELLKNEDFYYDEEGYARLGEKYVIACDESMGDIGDVITFVKEDGQEIECVIGITTNEEANKDTIHFIIDKNKAYSFSTNEVSETILDDVLRVENRSNVFDLDQLKKENPIAAEVIDHTNQNIKETEFTPIQTENGDYHCSTFIQDTYKASDITLPNIEEIPVDNKKAFFAQSGFEWVEGPIDTANLKPGDILVKEDQYSEMYYGNGFYVGAFSLTDAEEEERKLRISKSTNDYSNYSGYLRYVGTKV